MKRGATETKIPTLADDVGLICGLAAAGAAKANSSNQAAAAPGHALWRSGGFSRLPVGVNAPEIPGLVRLALSFVIPLRISRPSQVLVALSSAMDAFPLLREVGDKIDDRQKTSVI